MCRGRRKAGQHTIRARWMMKTARVWYVQRYGVCVFKATTSDSDGWFLVPVEPVSAKTFHRPATNAACSSLPNWHDRGLFNEACLHHRHCAVMINGRAVFVSLRGQMGYTRIRIWPSVLTRNEASAQRHHAESTCDDGFLHVDRGDLSDAECSLGGNLVGKTSVVRLALHRCCI